jgi:hypothetical protein
MAGGAVKNRENFLVGRVNPKTLFYLRAHWSARNKTAICSSQI